MNKEKQLKWQIVDLLGKIGYEETAKHFIEIGRKELDTRSDYIKKMDNEQNFCITIVQSPQWEAWDKVAHLRGWDSSESSETGWLSQKHLQAFLNFVKEEYDND